VPKYWFDHVHLISPDPVKTVAFYEKAFGAKDEGTLELADGRILTSVGLDGMSIKATSPKDVPLVPNTLPGGCGLEHFGLLTDNLEAAVAELKVKGLRFVKEITEINPKTRIAFFLSPEDILVELVERSD